MSNIPYRNERAAGDDDYELVCLSQKGNLAAFGALVEKYQKNMVNIAYRMLGDYERASDAVQDAFISAYKGIRKFRGDAAFSTWLYRIMINVSKNQMKQMRSRSQREGPSIDALIETEDGQLKGDLPDPAPSVEEQLETKEVQAKVQFCIGCLDHEYREVIVLRDIQGLSYGEICAILKIPDGTVKSRLFRARDALKDHLKNVFGDLS